MTARLFSLLFRCALACIACMPGMTSAADSDFLNPEAAFVLRAPVVSENGDVTLGWDIAPGYYLYRDRIEVSAGQSKRPIDAVKPPGEVKEDPTFGTVQVYHSQATVRVPSAAGQTLGVTWQGCAEAGLCYPPQTRSIKVGAAGSGSGLPDVSGTSIPADATTRSSLIGQSDQQVSSLLSVRSLAWTIPMFLLMGVALAFTPCVLPMMPIVSSVVVGANARPRRAFVLSLSFVIPMAMTYAALGVGAAMAGANLQSMLMSQGTILFMGAIFFILSLAMFGVFTLQLPGWIRQRLDRASRQREGGSARSAAGLGVLSALLVGPCMTAPLAGTLIYIAQSGNVVEGALLLFSLGLGMGLPLILMGTVGAGYLPKPGVWMDRVKNGFGFALLATAVWTVTPAVPAQAALALWSALLLLLAITVWQMSATASVRQRVVVMTVGLLAGAWSAALLVGALSGGTEPLRPLAQFAARGSDAAVGADRAHDAMTVMTSADLSTRLVDAGKAGRVAVVDFWADWCVECKVIDREVFGDSRVRAALEGVDVIRVDVSANTPDQRALMRTRQVLGPPTVLLVDGEGQEARAARLVGAFNSETFLQRLDAVESSDD